MSIIDEEQCRLCDSDRDWLVLAYNPDLGMAYRVGGIDEAQVVAGTEITDICLRGHARTRHWNSAGPTAAAARSKRSQVVALWGSRAAGKTHLVRRLIKVYWSTYVGGGTQEVATLVTPLQNDGTQDGFPPGLGEVARRTATEGWATSRQALVDYIRRKTEWSRPESVDFLDAALAAAGVPVGNGPGETGLWGQQRHPLIRGMKVERNSSGGQSWMSELWFLDEPGEIFNPGGGYGRGTWDRVEQVLWFVDAAIQESVIDELEGDMVHLASLRLRDHIVLDVEDADQAKEWESEQLSGVSARSIAADMQRNVALENARQWAQDQEAARRVGVVLTKLDLVWRMLRAAERRHQEQATIGVREQETYVALKELFAVDWKDGVTRAAQGLARLVDVWRDRGQAVSSAAQVFINAFPAGGADGVISPEQEAVAEAILLQFGTADGFWNLVARGRSVQFEVPMAARTFSLESIEDYYTGIQNTDSPPEIQIRDLVSTVVGRGLLGLFGYEDEALGLRSLKTVTETYFLTSLIKDPGVDLRFYESRLVADGYAGAGVKHLHSWLWLPLLRNSGAGKSDRGVLRVAADAASARFWGQS